MDILEKIRNLIAGEDGDDLPSLEEIKQARSEVRAQLREVEERLEERARARDEVLVEGTESDLEAHDLETERLEREAERLEAAGERLLERTREAELEAWNEEVREIVGGLPELADRHRRARDALAAVEAEVKSRVGTLRQHASYLSLRGSPVHLDASELRRIERVVEGIPELRFEFLEQHFRAPPEKENGRQIVETKDEDGTPVLGLVGDWSEDEVRAKRARYPDRRVRVVAS